MSKKRATVLVDVGTPAAARMRRATVVAMVVMAFLDALVLLVTAVAGTGGPGTLRHIVVGVGLLAFNGVPLALYGAPGRLRVDLTDLALVHRRLLLVWALAGGALLWLDAPTRSLYLPAAMTPIGVASMFGYRFESVAAMALVLGGHAATAVSGHAAAGTAEVLLSDTVTVVGLLLTTLAAAHIGMRTVNEAVPMVAELRADPDRAARRAPNGSPAAWHARTPAQQRRATIEKETLRLLVAGRGDDEIVQRFREQRPELSVTADDVRNAIRRKSADLAPLLGVEKVTRAQLAARAPETWPEDFETRP